MTETLIRAALYRIASLLVEPPRDGLREEISAVALTLPEPLASALHAIGAPDATEYHRLLGPSGACRDCESDWDTVALAGKGPLLADVAGFYRAFHFESQGTPDHISNELSFLGYLALKEAYAQHRGDSDQAQLCRDAAASFVRDHLGWAPAFFTRLSELAGDGRWGAAACFAAEALRDAMCRTPGNGPRP
jgi:TorA maturation chaperone TorD